MFGLLIDDAFSSKNDVNTYIIDSSIFNQRPFEQVHEFKHSTVLSLRFCCSYLHQHDRSISSMYNNPRVIRSHKESMNRQISRRPSANNNNDHNGVLVDWLSPLIYQVDATLSVPRRSVTLTRAKWRGNRLEKRICSDANIRHRISDVDLNFKQIGDGRLLICSRINNEQRVVLQREEFSLVVSSVEFTS